MQGRRSRRVPLPLLLVILLALALLGYNLYASNWHDFRVTAQKVAKRVKNTALELKEEARALRQEGGASLIQNSLLEQHVTGAGS